MLKSKRLLSNDMGIIVSNTLHHSRRSPVFHGELQAICLFVCLFGIVLSCCYHSEKDIYVHIWKVEVGTGREALFNESVQTISDKDCIVEIHHGSIFNQKDFVV